MRQPFCVLLGLCLLLGCPDTGGDDSSGPPASDDDTTSDDDSADDDDSAAGGACALIQLEPQTWDAGDLGVGCAIEQPITISNIGDEPLELMEVIFSPTSDDFCVSWYFTPGEIYPGEARTVTVYYEPRDELPDSAHLYVMSNDPSCPDAMATQSGTGHFDDEVVEEFEATGFQDTYPLSEQPVPWTVEVELNGSPSFVGWFYDQVFNAVVFEPESVPDVGDLITVRYNLLSQC